MANTFLSQHRSLYGEGPAFPFQVSANGRLGWSSGEDNVRQSIRILLLTEPGERIMREEFGCGLRRFLFEPNTPATRELIRDRVTRSIERWEPRVSLESVTVYPDSVEERTVHIDIIFRLVATQIVQRLALSIQLEE